MYKLLVAVLIVVLLMILQNYYFYIDYFRGVWVATHKFAAEAQIDNMIIYINQDKAYFLIYKNDQLLYNDTIPIVYSTWASPFLSNEKIFNVHIDCKDDLSEIIPADFKAKLNINKAKLTFYDDKKTYAKLKRGH